MVDEKDGSVHWSFWILGVVTLLWNLMGSINFIVQMNPEAITAYREAEQAIIGNRPWWATGAFALAVFSGSFGSFLLLLRKSVATYFFVGSLLGVGLTLVHTLAVGIDFGFGEILGIILMPLAMAVFLIWYSRFAEKKNWIE